MNLTIREAQIGDVQSIGELFDQYRQFYEYPPNVDAATRYISDRLTTGTSVVLVAVREKSLLGFAQMYPTWCSLQGGRVYVLYDLFVAPNDRRHGVGRQLMQAAADRAKRDGMVRLDLSTAKSNSRAQSLYESLGWQRDNHYCVYSLKL